MAHEPSIKSILGMKFTAKEQAHCHECAPAKPAGNKLWWAVGTGAVAIGAFCISRFGKKENTQKIPMNDKTDKERAKDVAYTINHALACTATDFIDPYVGNVTQKYIGKRVSIGCGHDHSKDAPCTHGSHLGHWWVGEVVGDFGAVPVTIAVQRLAPNFMHGLQKIMEPVLGGYFRKGAERAAKKWAAANGFAADSKEYKQRVETIYHHEVDHLPQALMWTASSITLNLTTQRLLGNTAPLWHLATGKATGASISAALVVGGRGFAPGAAEKWDELTSENLFLPATKWMGKIFGVNEKTVDEMNAEKNGRSR